MGQGEEPQSPCDGQRVLSPVRSTGYAAKREAKQPPELMEPELKFSIVVPMLVKRAQQADNALHVDGWAYPTAEVQTRK